MKLNPATKVVALPFSCTLSAEIRCFAGLAVGQTAYLGMRLLGLRFGVKSLFASFSMLLSDRENFGARTQTRAISVLCFVSGWLK